MSNLAILYNYYNFKTNIITIGGIQTYISDLIVVARKNGFNVTLFQKGEANNEKVFQDYRFVELPTKIVMPSLQTLKKKQIRLSVNGLCPQLCISQTF